MSYSAAELLEKFEGNETFVRFIKDMRKTGATMSVYSARGDFGKERPCAYTDDDHDLQSLIRATKVRVRHDTLGRREVVYP